MKFCLGKQLFTFLGPSGSYILTSCAFLASPVLQYFLEVAVAENDRKLFAIFFFARLLQPAASPGAHLAHLRQLPPNLWVSKARDRLL